MVKPQKTHTPTKAVEATKATKPGWKTKTHPPKKQKDIALLSYWACATLREDEFQRFGAFLLARCRKLISDLGFLASQILGSFGGFSASRLLGMSGGFSTSRLHSTQFLFCQQCSPCMPPVSVWPWARVQSIHINTVAWLPVRAVVLLIVPLRSSIVANMVSLRSSCYRFLWGIKWPGTPLLPRSLREFQDVWKVLQGSRSHATINSMASYHSKSMACTIQNLVCLNWLYL